VPQKRGAGLFVCLNAKNPRKHLVYTIAVLIEYLDKPQLYLGKFLLRKLII
jgi:hypothetical protein